MNLSEQGVDTFLENVKEEVADARKKFPTTHHLMVALMEEVGELANALLEHDKTGSPGMAKNVYEEAVQVACVALRVATEGTREMKYPLCE